jgi:hypothetical protein
MTVSVSLLSLRVAAELPFPSDRVGVYELDRHSIMSSAFLDRYLFAPLLYLHVAQQQDSSRRPTFFYLDSY